MSQLPELPQQPSYQKGDRITYRSWMPDSVITKATIERIYYTGQWQIFRLSNGIIIAAHDCEKDNEPR